MLQTPKITPLKFNMEPQDAPLENELPFGTYHFQVPTVELQGCRIWPKLEIILHSVSNRWFSHQISRPSTPGDTVDGSDILQAQVDMVNIPLFTKFYTS